MKTLTLLEIKQALWDERFRELFPEHREEINAFIKNPGCSCNVDLYKKLFSYKDRIKKYFPTRVVSDEVDPPGVRWKVINCHVNELEKHLRKLSHGKKQIAVARFEDQITVIVNDID